MRNDDYGIPRPSIGSLCLEGVDYPRCAYSDGAEGLRDVRQLGGLGPVRQSFEVSCRTGTVVTVYGFVCFGLFLAVMTDSLKGICRPRKRRSRRRKVDGRRRVPVPVQTSATMDVLEEVFRVL